MNLQAFTKRKPVLIWMGLGLFSVLSLALHVWSWVGGPLLLAEPGLKGARAHPALVPGAPSLLLLWGPRLELLVWVSGIAWIAFSLYRQRRWRSRTLPEARQARLAQTQVLRILLPKDSLVGPDAARELFEKVAVMIRSSVKEVVAGQAISLSWELLADPNGTAFYIWVPPRQQGDTDIAQVLRNLILHSYPTARVTQVPDPLRLHMERGGEGGRVPAVVVSWVEYGLAADSIYPIRGSRAFTTDPLQALMSTLRITDPGSLCGMQVVTTAFSGGWVSDLRAAQQVLRVRESTAKRSSLGVPHKEEVLALQAKLDMQGFDTLLRVLVIERALSSDDAGLQAAVGLCEARHQVVGRVLEQWDLQSGNRLQGFRPLGKPQIIKLPEQDAADLTQRWAQLVPLLGRCPLPYEPGWLPWQPRRLHILNSGELGVVYHFPYKDLAPLPGLLWQTHRTFAPSPHTIIPAEVVQDPVGRNPDHWIITGQADEDQVGNRPPRFIGTRRDDGDQGRYVLGPAGSGKSKLLEKMIEQLLQMGDGVGVIDAKGDLFRKTLMMVPADREHQVCVFDIETAGDRIPGLNLMDPTDVQRLGPSRVSSYVIGVLRKVMSNWEQAVLMQRIIKQSLMGLLESEPEPTMLALYRWLQNEDGEWGNTYREEHLPFIQDPMTSNFWRVVFAGWPKGAKESCNTASTRIETFLSNPLIRGVVAQTQSTIPLRRLMDKQGIFVAQVTVELGEDIQQFIGSLLVNKFLMAAFSRNDIPDVADRQHFSLFIDEFQNFVNTRGSDIEAILSMTRAFHLDLTIAHQAITQVENVLDVILGNVASKFIFKLQGDAPRVARWLPGVKPEDLMSLPAYHTLQMLLANRIPSDGPITAKPLGMAPDAANPGALGPVPTRFHPLLKAWLNSSALGDGGAGRLGTLTRPERDESSEAQRTRLSALVRELYGAGQDEQATKILSRLDKEDFVVYRTVRRELDREVRADLIRHPQLVRDKIKRITRISNLQYATPRIEVDAMMLRVLGVAGDPESVEEAFMPQAPVEVERTAPPRPRVRRTPQPAAAVEGNAPPPRDQPFGTAS